MAISLSVPRRGPTVAHRTSHWLELVYTFARRDIQARYKQSLLGLYWALLNPLVTAGTLALVFSHILNVSTGNVPFPIFVLSGLLGWNLFANGLGSAVTSVSSYATMLAKVKFPREALPVAAVLARWVDFIFSLAAVLAIMASLGMPITTNVIWVIPLVLAMTLMAVGLGMIVAALNVYYRDTAQIVPLVLNLWFYFSPVLYPADAFPPQWRFAMWANPPGMVVEQLRGAVAYGRAPDTTALLWLLGIGCICALVGYVVFRRMQRRFAEIL